MTDMDKDITINGIPIASMGVTLEAGWMSALMTPAPIKGLVSNDDPTMPGKQVITELHDGTSAAVVKERDVTLTFLIKGTTLGDFLEKYTSFVSVLHKGKVTLHVPCLNKHFRLIYGNATKYNSFGNACTLAVKFTEPNPEDRESDNV